MRPLSILETLSGALGCLNNSRGPLSRALLIPAASLAALDVAHAHLNSDKWLFAVGHGIAYLLVYSVFAVSCHRIILLGASSLPNRWGCYFTSREGRFFGWLLLIGLMALPAYLAITLLVAGLMLTLPERIAESQHLSVFAFLVAGMPAWYLISRASLVLPATAIDQRTTMSRAWRLTEDNGWRLTLALTIPVVFLWSVEWFLDSALGAPQGPLWSTLLTLGICLLGAFDVAVLSVAFRLVGGPMGDEAAA